MTRFAAAVALVAWLAGPAAARDVEVKSGGDVAAVAGARAAGSLTVRPLDGHSLHAGAGITIRLSGPRELGLERKRLTLQDAADPRAEAPRFDLPFHPTAAGRFTLAADVRFWICAQKTCRPVREKLAIQVTVTRK